MLGEPTVFAKRTFDEPMRWPMSYGIGGAYRHSDALTVSADFYRTEWSSFRRRDTKIEDGTHKAINPISGERYADARVSGTTQLHAGAEYLFVFSRTVVPIRGGIFYDPEPRTARTNHFYGVAAGSGFSFEDTVVDVAYQLRLGPNADPSVIHPRRTALVLRVRRAAFLTGAGYETLAGNQQRKNCQATRRRVHLLLPKPASAASPSQRSIPTLSQRQPRGVVLPPDSTTKLPIADHAPGAPSASNARTRQKYTTPFVSSTVGV
jgi:hypothetical protein